MEVLQLQTIKLNGELSIAIFDYGRVVDLVNVMDLGIFQPWVPSS